MVLSALSYLQFLVIMNNAFINSHVQVFVSMCIFTSLGQLPPRNGIASSDAKSCFQLLCYS